MSEESLKHFYDALDAAQAILRFTQNKTFENYCNDELLCSGVERKFEIIGEALNRIKRTKPKDLSALSEWPAIIGFRNILAHGYDHVEDSVVWGIIESQLPSFIAELEKIPGILDNDV
jgi:uncharacterized protein with HEPN domain